MHSTELCEAIELVTNVVNNRLQNIETIIRQGRQVPHDFICISPQDLSEALFSAVMTLSDDERTKIASVISPNTR